MDMNPNDKVHDILSAPDHLWYNRTSGHKRLCDRHKLEHWLQWLHTCCEQYCMIEYNSYQSTLWFESESDAILWDLAHS